MSLADDGGEARAGRIAESLVAGMSDIALHPNKNGATTDAETAADRVAEHWVGAARSLIRSIDVVDHQSME